jgi:Protein of unknown function (DUF3343)
MLLLFRSTHDVIMAEKALRRQGIPRRVIPVPRSVSSQCGMALEIAPEHAEKAVELLDSSVFPETSTEEDANGKRYQIYVPESDT